MQQAGFNMHAGRCRSCRLSNRQKQEAGQKESQLHVVGTTIIAIVSPKVWHVHTMFE